MECQRRLYDPQVRQIKLIGSVVEDERQLDGSRHVEIVGDEQSADLALRLVIDRDGLLQEAELSLEVNGTYVVIGFDQRAEMGSEERLSVHLRSSRCEAEVLQRDDGEIALAVTLYDVYEVSGPAE